MIEDEGEGECGAWARNGLARSEEDVQDDVFVDVRADMCSGQADGSGDGELEGENSGCGGVIVEGTEQGSDAATAAAERGGAGGF